MIVDAHVHFWDRARGHDIVPARKMAGLAFDFRPADLVAASEGVPLDAVVVIEAASSSSETRELLASAAEEDLIGGVVGWVDLSADGVATELDRLAESPWFRGTRLTPSAPATGGALDDPRVLAGMRALAARSLTLDLLVDPVDLEGVRALGDAIPDLAVVIDHGGRPLTVTGELEPWAGQMRAIARETGAFCKLSGLIERAGFAWTPASLRPYVEVLLEAFGPDRLMFASNWPVSNLLGTWCGWWQAVQVILDDLDVADDARSRIFGGTSVAFYRLAHSPAPTTGAAR